jgi:hydrogenase-4 membrane subunit HyfE
LSSGVVWIVVALGLGVPTLRRRSVAIALVTAQGLLLALTAAVQADALDELVAAGALLCRAILLCGLLLVAVRRTREARPVRADAGPLMRGGLAVGLALLLALLVPSLGLGDRNAERALLALVAFALVTLATRWATVFHIAALVQIDNALAVAALAAGGGLPGLIELGVAADLIVVVLVAALLHARIYAEFGSGDTTHLGALRD